MGKDALGVQPRQAAGLANALHTAFKMCPADQVSQAGHPRVHLDMYLQRAAAADSFFAILQGLSLAGNGLGDVVFNELFHLLLGGVAQDQNGHSNAPQPQLHGLVDAADSQVVRPAFLQHLRHPNGPVAVGIRLHHAQKLHTRADVPAQLFVVFPQSVQINDRPGPPQCRFHIVASFIQ